MAPFPASGAGRRKGRRGRARVHRSLAHPRPFCYDGILRIGRKRHTPMARTNTPTKEARRPSPHAVRRAATRQTDRSPAHPIARLPRRRLVLLIAIGAGLVLLALVPSLAGAWRQTVLREAYLPQLERMARRSPYDGPVL